MPQKHLGKFLAVSIGLPDIKLLWSRSGGLCNLCRTKLSEDKRTSNESFPFGQQAHIIAEEINGPRGKSRLTANERNSYPNLILLCPNDHAIIDNDVEEYSVEKLHIMKSVHELWFEKHRVSAADRQSETNQLVYADLVNSAVKCCMFEEWKHWTSWASGPENQFRGEWLSSFREFYDKIAAAVWPGTLPELERALKALAINLNMMTFTFYKHGARATNGWFTGTRFYRDAKSRDDYERLLHRYNVWVGRLHELIFEATKSANWLAEIVRRNINPLFLVTIPSEQVGRMAK